MSDPKEDALTLAVLCDLILGEDAADRSNNALVMAAGKLVRERNELRSSLQRLEGDNQSLMYRVSDSEREYLHLAEIMQAIRDLANHKQVPVVVIDYMKGRIGKGNDL